MIDNKKIAELKAFVQLVQSNPQVIHMSELSFFKEYLESMGACIPPVSAEKPSPSTEEAKDEPEQEVPESESETDEDEYKVDPVILSELQKDDSIIPAEKIPFPPAPNMATLELADDDLDKMNDLKSKAADAVEDGKFDDALGLYNQVLEIGNPTAMVISKRAEILLKLNRPSAAKSDCNAALALNPDNARAYRIRGKANALVGAWEEAHNDIETAQRIDFDDGLVDTQAFVSSKWKKIQDYIRTKTRAREAHDLKERVRRSKRAREANTDIPPNLATMLADLMKDPEISKLISKPEVATAIQEIFMDPTALAKYADNAEVMTALGKIQGLLGGSHQE